jgi:hypothetical protein
MDVGGGCACEVEGFCERRERIKSSNSDHAAAHACSCEFGSPSAVVSDALDEGFEVRGRDIHLGEERVVVIEVGSKQTPLRALLISVGGGGCAKRLERFDQIACLGEESLKTGGISLRIMANALDGHSRFSLFLADGQDDADALQLPRPRLRRLADLEAKGGLANDDRRVQSARATVKESLQGGSVFNQGCVIEWGVGFVCCGTKQSHTQGGA